MKAEDIFFPYPFEPDQLAISGVTGSSTLQADLDLRHVHIQWMNEQSEESIRFTGSITDIEDTLPALVPESEWGDPPLRLVAVLHCSSTFRRWSESGSIDLKSGEFEFKVKLNRSSVQGIVDLDLQLVRSQSQGERADLARVAGAKVMRSLPWTLYADPRGSVEGPGLRPEWELFAESPDEFRRRNPDLVFCLDPAGPGGEPVLYLNSGIPELQTVLEEEAPHGKRAALRDLVFASIAGPVWVGLVQAAVTESDENGHSDQAWIRNVMTQYGERAYPGLQGEEARRRVKTVHTDPNSAAMAAEQLIAISTQIASLSGACERLFSTVGGGT